MCLTVPTQYAYLAHWQIGRISVVSSALCSSAAEQNVDCWPLAVAAISPNSLQTLSAVIGSWTEKQFFARWSYSHVLVVVTAVTSLAFFCLFSRLSSARSFSCIGLWSRRSRQRERLHATGVSICSSVCLFVCLFVCLSPNCKNAIFSKTKQFRAMVSIDDL